MRHALALVLVGSLAALGACQSAQEADSQPATRVSMGAINDTCPVAGESFDPANPPASVTYAGQTVGFCCGGCVKRWESWDDQTKADFVASAGH